MPRSVWKGPLLNTNINSVSRNATVIPPMIGKQVRIHNGKSHVSILVTEEMLSRKFGEFAATTKDFSYKKKEDNKKKRF